MYYAPSLNKQDKRDSIPSFRALYMEDKQINTGKSPEEHQTKSR